MKWWRKMRSDMAVMHEALVLDTAIRALPRPRQCEQPIYQPVGPYHVATHPGNYLELDLDLEGAVHEFIRHGLPMQPGDTAYVADDNGVVMIGYTYDDVAVPIWLGHDDGLRWFRDHELVNPILAMEVDDKVGGRWKAP